MPATIHHLATIHDLHERRRQIECLACGQARHTRRGREGDCPRCGYIGWAPTEDLDEGQRRTLRDHPIPERSLARRAG